jgi:hypothetical protein
MHLHTLRVGAHIAAIQQDEEALRHIRKRAENCRAKSLVGVGMVMMENFSAMSDA